MKKATAYASALLLAGLTWHFVRTLVGPLYLHYDRPVAFSLSLAFLLVQVVGWVYLSAFLYSRLAPLEAMRARTRKDASISR